MSSDSHLDATYADAVAAMTIAGGTEQLDPKSASDTVARMSSTWEHDTSQQACAECTRNFTALNRRHHCRLCGKIFCQDCSSRRALIPPSAIVLTPKGGKSAAKGDKPDSGPTFEEDDDPDRVLTYMRSPEEGTAASGDTVLYGKGLEERYKLAREPLRVCDLCYDQLLGVQDELRVANSNAMRYNTIDPTDVRRLFNSPLAFTLGHEVRKAAYTLNNLLPLPKRMGAFVTSDYPINSGIAIHASQLDQCKDTCTEIGGNFTEVDGVRIPARLLEAAKGVAVLTVVKGGFGPAGFEFGTGLVVARLPDERGWSAPSAIGTAGVSWGALIGAQVSDHVFLLMTDAAINLMSSKDGSFQLGADIGVAVGPLGRSLEGNVGATGSSGTGGFAFAPIYTYSLSRGLYAGLSLDGKVIATRHLVNEKFYGYQVKVADLLNGEVPTPPAAQPLYDALKRCHVYAAPTQTVKTKRATVSPSLHFPGFEDPHATETAAIQAFSNLTLQQGINQQRQDMAAAGGALGTVE